MLQAMSVFSTSVINRENLSALMKRLQAEPESSDVDDVVAWKLVRSNRIIYIELPDSGMEDLPEEMIKDAAELLGGEPRSRIVFMYPDDTIDRFEYRMAIAAGRAMAEHWPIVVDDYTGSPQRLEPPGSSQSLENPGKNI